MRGAARIITLSAFAACVGGPYTDYSTSASAGATGATTGGATGGTTVGVSTSGASTTSGPPPTSGDPPATGDGECIFHSECMPDGGPGPACSVWVQDCAPGEKCMPYDGDGFGSWDSTKCVPIAPNAGEPGAACTVEGGPGSGVDDCALGGICLGTGDGDLEGTCTALCQGFPNNPECTDPMATCIELGSIDVCAPTCHPLEQGCPADQVCCPEPGNSERFICVVDVSGDGGQEFGECEYANGCDPGLLCSYPELAVECDQGAAGCCLKYCDLSQPDCDAMMAECLPWFEMGQAPMGLETLGICGIPR
jgi:hypothetical protein